MNYLTEIRRDLLSLGDTEYKAFHSKLIPTVAEDCIIGVRTPVLRKYARQICGSAAADVFLGALPHRFYEENNLHAFLLEQFAEYDEAVKRIDEFLPYVDNWATCDMMSPKSFAKNKDRLYKDALRWLENDKVYTVRFGICMLMKHYLDECFRTDFLEKVAAVKSEEYYVKMAVAWYFATALTKRYEETLPYIQNKALDKWTHNKAIQKACESYQVPKERKDYLKTLKIIG